VDLIIGHLKFIIHLYERWSQMCIPYPYYFIFFNPITLFEGGAYNRTLKIYKWLLKGLNVPGFSVFLFLTPYIIPKGHINNIQINIVERGVIGHAK